MRATVGSLGGGGIARSRRRGMPQIGAMLITMTWYVLASFLSLAPSGPLLLM
jgi:hypothetical protein